ncbi:MAG TPA: hypothetical protein VFP71_03750 [Candidatus Angelobacter sp.]|nr:hypothetical protein [Candidatus Angelobacter sp.]
MSRIHLVIDRIVLNGLQPGQDKAVVESLKKQLTTILSDRRARAEWARSHRTPVLKLGNVPMANGTAGAKTFGTQVARGIGKGLKP